MTHFLRFIHDGNGRAVMRQRMVGQGGRRFRQIKGIVLGRWQLDETIGVNVSDAPGDDYESNSSEKLNHWNKPLRRHFAT